MKTKLLAMAAGGAMMVGLGLPVPASALTINATYGSGFSAGDLAIMGNVVNFYQTTFSDPISVDIGFYNMASGLGQSTTYLVTVGYSSFHTALIADQSSTADATALASLPGGATNPVTGSGSVSIKTANARALGFSASGGSLASVSGCPIGTGDSCIGLNLSLIGSTPYSLAAVAMHEIDEALGLGSELPSTSFLGGHPQAEDLFRWSAAGVRSYASNASCTNPPTAYLSIDGGVTNLVGLNNCDNGGDYGDWVSSSLAQVQDAFGTPGSTPTLTSTSPEVIGLDVIGYNLNTTTTEVPEPASLALLGFGLAGLGFARRKRNG